MMDAQELPQMIRCDERIDKPDRLADPFIKMYAHVKSGKACIRLPDTVHDRTEKSEHQSRWDTVKFSIIVTQAFQRSQMVPGSMPLPQFGYVQQVLIQNFIVRLLSVFDNLLADVLSMNEIVPQKETLFERINALEEHGMVADVSQAHSARTLRNDISHDIVQEPLDWTAVSGIADDLEAVLVETEIIEASPVYSSKEISFTGNGVDLPDTELHRKKLTIKIEKNGKPAVDFNWQYVWFLDPDWTYVGNDA